MTGIKHNLVEVTYKDAVDRAMCVGGGEPSEAVRRVLATDYREERIPVRAGRAAA